MARFAEDRLHHQIDRLNGDPLSVIARYNLSKTLLGFLSLRSRVLMERRGRLQKQTKGISLRHRFSNLCSPMRLRLHPRGLGDGIWEF